MLTANNTPRGYWPCARCALLIALVTATTPSVWAQGYDAREAAAHMGVPDGFSVSLVAAEPMVTQPVAIEFDDRGRLWVVQYRQYPNPAGLKRVSVDRWSRTKYDRVPPPPPRGPKGNDALTILEDTDGDGRADTQKDFVTGLNLCTGLAFGHGGVFVLQVPYLLFYADRDGDDMPDGDPEVCVTGFGMEDAHSVANSLTWGPDGWLYGNQGSTVTAHIDGIEFQQGVWRYHPGTHKFELFCEGGGNMWGLDFDPEGNLFASTNFGPYLMLHAEKGAYYWKSFGKHGALHNPYAYGYFEHVTQHNPVGGHVTTGGLIYQGDAFPPEYNGKYIACNLLSHTVHFNDVTPLGSTFETTHRGLLLDSRDTSFAPSDLTTGPDGALYVADWNDKRTAHPDPDAQWDKATGRIYRIAYNGEKPMPKFDLAKKSSAELAGLLSDKNGWFRRRARVLLAPRRQDPVASRLRDQLIDGNNAGRSIEMLWAIWGMGKIDVKLVHALLHDKDALFRRWAVRWVGDSNVMHEFADDLRSLAHDEHDPHVLIELVAAAKRGQANLGFELCGEIARRDPCPDDPHLPLMLWWAVEAHAMAEPGRAIGILQAPAVVGTRAGSFVLPRLMRRFAADGSARGDRACVQMLEGSRAGAGLLSALEQGLQERGHVQTGVEQGGLFESFATASTESAKRRDTGKPLDDELRNTLNRLYGERPGDRVLLRIALRIGNESAYARAKELARDRKSPPTDRAAVLAMLGDFGKADCVDLLFDAAKSEDDANARDAAIGALRHFNEERIASSLLDCYATAKEEARVKIRDVLFAKPMWTRTFLDKVETGTIDAKDVPLAQLRGIAAHEDKDLNARVEKIWGRIAPGTPEEKLAQMRHLANELRVAKGDPAKGKKLFDDNCMKCHKLFGEGAEIGPDLTQSNRMDKDYLLANLVDPSAVVRKEYRQFVVKTNDGEVYNGVFGKGEPGTVTIYNANAQPTAIAQSDIAEMREMDTSLMPENLVTPMSGEDVRDLFAYLQQEAPTRSP